MSFQLAHDRSQDLAELVRLERLAFAAKIRMARAALGWSQSELAVRAGLTQRSIHKLEQGSSDPRRATVRAIEMLWHEQGLEFEDLADGGFRVSIRARLLDDPAPARHRRPGRPQLGVAMTGRRPIHRA